MDNERRADIIVRSASRLTPQERAAVARRILEGTAPYRTDAPTRYASLLPLAEEAVGRRMTTSRSLADVMIRRFVAYRMRKEGFAFTEIGAAMGKHYTTAIHYCRMMGDCFDEPIFYAGEIALYLRFEEAAEEAGRDVE